MLTLTLDTGCFYPNLPELDELMKMFREGKINIQISPITIEEITNDHPMKMKQYIEYLREIETIEIDESEEFDKVSDKVFRIRLKTKDNTDKRLIRLLNNPDEWSKRIMKKQGEYRDYDIFAHHVLSKGDIFVTKDEKDFIKNGMQETLEREFKTKIRVLNKDFIEELELLTSN